MISRGLFYLYLGSSDFTDVTLACKDLQFEAHRLILSTCSPFLKQPLKKFKKQEQPLVDMGKVEQPGGGVGLHLPRGDKRSLS